jgi:hypothetical protein
LVEESDLPETKPAGRQRLAPFLLPTALIAIVAALELVVLAGFGFLTARRAEPVLRFFDPRRSPTMDEAWTATVMDYALCSTEGNDVVFLGDSICCSGIEPVQFRKLTRLRGYNLGVLFGGLGPQAAPSIVLSYLAKHPAPRLVVLCTSPVCFEKEVDAAYVTLHNRFLSCFAFEAPDLRSPEGIRAYVRSVLYLIQQGTVLRWYQPADGGRHDLRDDFLDLEKTQTYRSLEKLTRAQLGFYPMIGSGHKGFLDRRKRVVRIDPAWDRGVRRLASICQETNVPLLIRLGPIAADASQDLDFHAVEQWLNELKAANPRLLIASDNRLTRYPTELCFDPMHCNVAGAAKFTKQLAEEVTSSLKPTAADAAR